MGDTTKGSVYSDEFLAMERKVARLEQNLRNACSLLGRESMRVVDLKKQLVERDVYEAQQILPPEQAALIKHLKTVELCIEDGPREAHYADDSDCVFCGSREGQGHSKDCAWLALQFDRKPEATMTMVHEHALNEHETWERRQKPAISARQQWFVDEAHLIATMRENNIGPLPEVTPLSAEDALRASMAVRESQEALARRGSEIHRDMADAMVYGLGTVNIQVSNHVPPGTAYIMPSSFSVLPPEARPVASNLGIGGEEPTEVAPPDDEDVP